MDVDGLIRRLAAREHGVVVRRDLRDRGVSGEAIDRRVTGGMLYKRHRGIYVLAGTAGSLEQAIVAACRAAEGVASHETAAGLWGVLRDHPSPPFHVSGRRQVGLVGVVVHRTDVSDHEVCRRNGVRLTRMSRTLIDLAGVLSSDELERVLDDALSMRLTTVLELERRLRDLGTRGRRGAHVLARLVADRSEERRPSNGEERRFVKLLAWHRLPIPILQFEIVLPRGRRYIDAAFPEYKIGFEIQSYRHHSSVTSQAADAEREREPKVLGWQLIPITAYDIDHRPLLVVGQVATALAHARAGAA